MVPRWKESLKMGRVAKRKAAPKRTLRLLDLKHSKRTLLSTLDSADSKRAYEFAIDHFRRVVLFGAEIGV